MTDLTEGLLEGLLDRHVKALRRKRIRTAERLARADRRTVYEAFAGDRRRPRYALVDAWIAQAKALVALDADTARDETWETVAGFVLSFERHGDGARRLVAEQAERPAPQPRQEWEGWPVQDAAQWVADTVAEQVAAGGEPEVPGPDDPSSDLEEPGASLEPADAAPAPDRPRLVLDEVVLVGRDGDVDLLARGGEVTVGPGDRLRIHAVRAVPFEASLRARRRGRPPHRLGPVRSGTDGRAELDLRDLPPGIHDCGLFAHATDDGRNEDVPALAPAVVRLPPLALTR